MEHEINTKKHTKMSWKMRGKKKLLLKHKDDHKNTKQKAQSKATEQQRVPWCSG